MVASRALGHALRYAIRLCGPSSNSTSPRTRSFDCARIRLRFGSMIEPRCSSTQSALSPIAAGHVAADTMNTSLPASRTRRTPSIAPSSGGRSRKNPGRVGSLSANQTRNLERLKQLRAQNFISQAALDDAIAQNAAIENQLSGARAQLGLAERNVGKTNVVSPVDGRVEKQIAVAGQYVKVGDPMFQVVSLNKLRARLPFPETLSGQVRRGMSVQIRAAGSDAVLGGKISEIRPMAGATNRAFDAYAMLDNPGNWRPGATVTASVVLDAHPDAVTVPEQSVVLRPVGEVVYVVEAGKARQRVVQLGINQGGRVEITSGLQAGETVVVDGAGFLSDGAAVTVASAQPSAGAQ